MSRQSTLVFRERGKTNTQNVKNLFLNYLKKPSIFKNKEVLTESFFPDEILHRDNELMQISSILAPALRGYKPNNLFIYGGVGTGKTVCVKLVLKQLEEIVKKNKLNVKPVYVNCKLKKVADTEYRLLAQLLFEIGIVVPDTGLPTDVLYRKFFNEVEKQKKIIIIALDEIDALVRKIGDDFLYNFTRINTELEKGKISFIGITNNLNFCNELDARVKSSLSEEEIIFHPYNATQLRDILKQRVDKAFNKGVVSDAVINKCAALAAQEHGDARRALDLLRVAGEIAERYNSDVVTEEHVDIAEKKIDLDGVTESIRKLPRQSQAVLNALLKLTNNSNKPVTTIEVFNVYRDICLKNNLRVLTTRRVSDLLNELTTLGIINTRVVSKGRYGRTREITLNIDSDVRENVEKILSLNFN